MSAVLAKDSFCYINLIAEIMHKFAIAMFDLVYSICDKGAHDSLPATFDYPCRHWRIDVA